MTEEEILISIKKQKESYPERLAHFVRESRLEQHIKVLQKDLIYLIFRVDFFGALSDDLSVKLKDIANQETTEIRKLTQAITKLFPIWKKLKEQNQTKSLRMHKMMQRWKRHKIVKSSGRSFVGLNGTIRLLVLF